MISIQDPESPIKIAHMDWVMASPSGGDRIFNACLALVDRYRKDPIFSPCHKDDTALETDMIRCNRVISHTVLFKNIISDRDPKFTPALWKNLHNLFGTKISFSTAYYPNNNGLEKRMIQNLEDMGKYSVLMA
ncbi:hypothetical protein O181_005331 [Austropuccinia psidii MF-1]|uniref:Integrase catalytic domain-containing protein n=1 Tax=Austropuccinia psidii MF-1 TaxID=1389203 RepID=A0A9Q3BH28_9BASI|nr:hypothetical protein [Austropuccinia psidii MF-1]